MRTLEFLECILIFANVTSSRYDKKEIVEWLEVKSKFASKRSGQKSGQRSGQRSKIRGPKSKVAGMQP